MGSLIDYVRDMVKIRHRRSMVEYLKNGREDTIHVTDLVYECPRYANLVYELRKSSKDDERNLSERDMTVFVVGKKLDELVVGDYHHVKLRYDFDGVVLIGEIDDLIVDKKNGIVVVIDKKHLRSRPPKEAHSHYIRQVNSYMALMLNECEIESCEFGDISLLKKLVREFDQYQLFGAILYIDVSLESNQISDVVVWEIDDRMLKSSWKFVQDMVNEVFGQASPRLSWFCGYCPFFKKCAEMGLGNGSG